MWVGIGEGYSQLVGTPPNVEWVTPKAILLGNQGCWTPISLEQAEELVVALQTKIKELRGTLNV